MALPVQTNPYITEHIAFKEQEQEIMKASRLLEIEGIYHWNKPLKEEVFDSVRIFCATHRIAFGIRVFNSDAFWQDRECLLRLPAFHIYYKDEYEKSFYCEDEAAIMIQEVLRDFKKPSHKQKTGTWWPSFKWPQKRKRKVPVVGSTNVA
jgi:hypothetical protein